MFDTSSPILPNLPQSIPDRIANLLIHPTKHGDGSLLHLGKRLAKMTRHVGREAPVLAVAFVDPPQLARLREVLVRHGRGVRRHAADPLVVGDIRGAEADGAGGGGADFVVSVLCLSKVIYMYMK